MNTRNRIGFRRASEVEEDVHIPSAPSMDEIQVSVKPITEGHQETRDRIEVLRSFIASSAFRKLPSKFRLSKVRELEWLSRVDAQLSAS